MSDYKLQMDERIDVEEVLKNLENYRPRRRGWVWREKAENQAAGPFQYRELSKPMEGNSVGLMTAHYFDNIDVLVAEIGSTTTVVNAFDSINSQDPVFLGQGQAPTSILAGDVRVGLQGAIKELCRNPCFLMPMIIKGMFITKTTTPGVKKAK